VWDENSQLQSSRQVIIRYDPTKDIVWYFEKGFPERYKAFFCTPAPANGDGTPNAHACAANIPGGVDGPEDTVRTAVNAIMVAAGAKHADGTPTQVIFKTSRQAKRRVSTATFATTSNVGRTTSTTPTSSQARRCLARIRATARSR
jgi:hypothetical protein